MKILWENVHYLKIKISLKDYEGIIIFIISYHFNIDSKIFPHPYTPRAIAPKLVNSGHNHTQIVKSEPLVSGLSLPSLLPRMDWVGQTTSK